MAMNSRSVPGGLSPVRGPEAPRTPAVIVLPRQATFARLTIRRRRGVGGVAVPQGDGAADHACLFAGVAWSVPLRANSQRSDLAFKAIHPRGVRGRVGDLDVAGRQARWIDITRIDPLRRGGSQSGEETGSSRLGNGPCGEIVISAQLCCHLAGVEGGSLVRGSCHFPHKRPCCAGTGPMRVNVRLGRVGSCLLAGGVRPELPQDTENGLAVVLVDSCQQLLLEPPVRPLDLVGCRLAGSVRAARV